MNLNEYVTFQSLNLPEAVKNNLIVPDIQRSYEWEAPDLRAFWEAVRKVCSKDVDAYFLGPIFLHKPSRIGDRHEVYDGQQRLTTSLCLASVLKKFVPFIENEQLSSSATATLHNMLYDQRNEPRLVIDRGNNFFKKNIVEFRTLADWKELRSEKKSGVTIGETALANALEFFTEKVWEYFFLSYATNDQDSFDNRFRAIFEGFTQKIFVAQGEVKELELLDEIYEGLNNTGKRLDVSALVKNTLLQGQEGQDRDQVKANWEALLDCTDEICGNNETTQIDLDQLILYSYHRRQQEINVTKLNENVKSDLGLLTHNGQPNETSLSLSRRFLEDAGLYKDFTKFQSADTLTTQSFARIKLSFLWKKNMIPLFMEFSDHYIQRRLDREETRWCFALFESVLFRFTLLKTTPAKIRGAVIPGVAALRQLVEEKRKNHRRIFDEGNFRLDEFLSCFRDVVPDNEFVSQMRVNRFNNTIGFYVTWWFEHANRPAGYTLNWQSPEQHLEHVMPKNRDAKGWSHISPEDHEAYLSTIGNFLILTRDENREVWDKRFHQKNAIYKKTDFALPKTLSKLVGQSDWTAAVIEQRSESLARDSVKKCWSLNATELDKIANRPPS